MILIQILVFYDRVMSKKFFQKEFSPHNENLFRILWFSLILSFFEFDLSSIQPPSFSIFSKFLLQSSNDQKGIPRNPQSHPCPLE